MNYLRFGMLSCACLLGASSMFAQTESVTSGGHGFVEDKNGNPASGIEIPEDRQGSVAGVTKFTTKWDNLDAVAVHYFHHPAAEVATKMVLKVKKGKTVDFRLKVYDPNNLQNPMAVNDFSVNGSGDVQEVEMVKHTFPRSDYYRYCLECLSGCKDIVEIQKFKHVSPSGQKTYKSGYLSSPSVHLSQWQSTDVNAPKGSVYDWCYQEVMMPKEADVKGTYVMSLGVLDGYMGIQMNGYENGKTRHDVIFSMWDKGNVDENPNLPENLRANVVDKNPLAKAERFNNEGTGMKTFMGGHYWECGTFVQFITNCRKEVASYKVMENGKEVTKTQENTLVSAWFNALDGKGWQYISTLRLADKHKRFDSWYSFLENFEFTSGQLMRKGFYRNGYACATETGSKKWYHFNKVNFGHTDGGNKEGQRNDFGQGNTSECAGPNGEGAFFMTTGGFATGKITKNMVPLNVNHTAVDTINLEALLARVDQAVAYEKQIIDQTEYFKNHQLVKDSWKVVDFSSENPGGYEGTNGYARLVIDGDDATYWHSNYSKKFPHHLTIDMNAAHVLKAMEIVMGTDDRRYITDFDLEVSRDNKTWKTVYSDRNVSQNGGTFRFYLEEPVNCRYFKIKINKSTATDGGDHVRISEIKVAGETSLEDMKIVAENYLKDPNATTVGYPALKYYEALKVASEGLSANENEHTTKAFLDALNNYVNTEEIVLPENGVLYTLASDGRGNFIVKDNVFQSTKNTNVNVTENYADVNQQFMFVEDNGAFYLYNPTVKKYLTKDANKLSDAPQDAFSISKHATWGHVFMSFDKDHNINFGGDNQLVIDNWATQDLGNAFRVDAVGLVVNLKPTAGAMAEQHVATFSAPFAVTSENGVKVYYATEGASKTTVKLMAVEEGKAIPANAGVLVAANEQMQARLVKAGAEVPVAELTGNVLQNSAAAPVQMVSGDYILLKPNTESMAFYKAKVGTTLPRYRAFLHMDNAAATIHMDFGGESTGIEGLEDAELFNTPIYDLSGRQVNRVIKGGIYIQNGKKFIVK